MAVFEGAGTAIVTPFHNDESVNFEKLGEMIDFQVDNGIDSIIICGTTGEASTLTHDEPIECIRYTVQRVNKRVPVIAGTGSNCTSTAVFLSKEAYQAGADALLLVSPYYNKATQKGMAAHFTRIAAAVDLPVILYNIPGRTGVEIHPSTIAELVKNVENIAGVKDAVDNIGRSADLMHECNGEIDLYAGNDDMVVPLMSLGGKGVISVLSNLLPKETHDMAAKYLAGDTKGSLNLQMKYLPLIRALFCEVNPIPVKKALNLMGMEAGPVRMPLSEMEEKNAERLKGEMVKAGLIKAGLLG